MQHAGNLMTVYIRIRVPIQRARNECTEVGHQVLGAMVILSVYAFAEGICRLMAGYTVSQNRTLGVQLYLPLNQFKASEGDGASKYRIALLSTRRKTRVDVKIDTTSPFQINLPVPWTMLAGWGKVCIRSTAHRSTADIGSFPSLGSLQRTRRSLHSIPMSGRGFSSGARQST